MELRRLTKSSGLMELEGAGPGLGGGAGGVMPGLTSRGTGDDTAFEGSSNCAFLRHKVANSNVGTGTAYDWLSVLSKECVWRNIILFRRGLSSYKKRNK